MARLLVLLLMLTPFAASAQSFGKAGDNSVAVRNERFQVHRVVGLVTGALYLATTTLAVITEVQRNQPGSDVRALQIATASSAIASQLSFGTTYLFAGIAPPRLDGTPLRNILHQVFVYSAGALNVTRIILLLVMLGQRTPSDGAIAAVRVASIGAPLLFATGAAIQIF